MFQIHHLMNVLKGEDLVYTERMQVVESIQALDSAGRADLVDFLASKVTFEYLKIYFFKERSNWVYSWK